MPPSDEPRSRSISHGDDGSGAGLVGAAYEFSEDSNVTPTVYAVADAEETDVRVVDF